MRTISSLLRVVLALGLALPSSCAISPAQFSGAGLQQRPKPVQVTRLPDGHLQLDFMPLPPNLAWEVLRVEDAHAELAAFHQAFRPAPPPLFRRSSTGTSDAWEQQLRREFLSRFGEPSLPLPNLLEDSRLYMALKLSTRYMAPGIRDAAVELFNSPIFLASVTLSVLMYFSAWVLPEPFFSKAFAAALTVRLALVVGLLELSQFARACVKLYREAEAARTIEELDAVAERFGHTVGGTALRVLVLVAGVGIGRALPKVPEGGLRALLSPPRYATVEGLVIESTATAHVVADGTLVIAATATGTAASALGSACSDGKQSQHGSSWHHLATDKNDISTARGGPWTPLFARLFAKADMSLDDPANLVYLAGHKGPHPERYHTEVFRRLEAALEDCRTVMQCKALLKDELRRLADDVCTPGSALHRLATTP